MKPKNTQLNRLLKLSTCLDTMYGYERLVIAKGNSNIKHFSKVLNLLPKVFKQWRFDKNGNAYLLSHPELNTITAAGYFFSLTADELFHLFIPNYQMKLLGGKSLNETSRIIDMSSHIDDFIEVKSKELDEDNYQLKKVKPIKNKNYEKYRTDSMSELWPAH